MAIALTLTVLSVLLWLNVRATLVIFRDVYSEQRHKAVQLLLVWFVPIIGALMVLAVHRPAEQPARRYREQPEAGDDFSMSGRAVKNTLNALHDD